MIPRLNSVPKMMLSVYEKIVGLTDDVCDKHLNSEYRDLARAMTRVLCRKRPSPLTSGQPRTWACGIVYVLGRINFLGDKSITPCMTTADLCAAFEVGEEPLPEFPQPWPSGNPVVIDYVTEAPNVSMDDRSAPVLAGPSGH